MKLSYLSLVLVFILALGCKNKTKEKPSEEPIAPVAVLAQSKNTFEDLDGNPVALSDYKGKRVLLNYWATWCRPCIEEMPAMLRAQEILKTENYVFLLASDQSLEKIKAFREKRQFDFKFLKFNGALADEQISALPATFIYNGAGEKVDRIDGATEWDSPEVLERLKAIE